MSGPPEPVPDDSRPAAPERGRAQRAWQNASLRRNVVVNWGATLAGIALSFALTPIVVNTLDKELYGVWSFLNGLTIYSGLLYVGLGSSFVKYISEARGRQEPHAVSRLLGVALTLYAGLGALAFAVAVGVSLFISTLFAQPLSPEAASSASIATVLLGVRLFAAFVGSACSAVVTSYGRMDITTTITLAGSIVRTLASFYAVRLPDPLVALAAVAAIEAVGQLVAIGWLCKAVAPGIRLAPVIPTIEELRQLYGFGVQTFVAQLAMMLISYTDTIVIGLMLGAESVSYYALPLQLVEYARTLINGVTLALLPELSTAAARGDLARLREIYVRAGRVCAFVAAFINVHVVILGPPFLALWVGDDFGQASQLVLVFLGLAAVGQAVSTQLQVPFFQAFSALRVAVSTLLIEAAVNLGLSVWLAPQVGIAGVALATALPSLGITLMVLPAHVHRRLGISKNEFGRHIALPALLVAVVSGGVLLALGASHATSYGSMILLTSASGLAALPVVLLTFPRQEWQPLVGWVTRGSRRG